MGKSFGGAVAAYTSLLTASDGTPASKMFTGLCLESTFTNAGDMIKKMSWGLLPRICYDDIKWSTVDIIRRIEIPAIMIVHGMKDTLVPLEMAKQLHK